MAVIDFKNTQMEIRGGTTANKVVVKFGEGNLTWQEKQERQYIKDRGKMDTVRNGDDTPVSVKFAAQYEFITGAGVNSTYSIEDALKQRGAASGWTTTSADPCEPYCVDLYFFDLVACGAIQQETIIFPEFRYETADHDPKAGTISFDGKCNVTQVTATRGTAAS